MSDYESHTGKLRKIEPKENETFEQLCKRLWLENGKPESEYSEGELFGEFYEKYINDSDKFIWEIFDHEEEKDGDGTVCKIFKTPDGAYSFYTHFYNGGTCLSEMIENEIENID